MPRANRHYIPGYVWHITHRCHKKEFLLKFPRDRRCWLAWLFEAKKRFGLSVLNYMVTSNHIHLLVSDNGDRHTIPKSIQLTAGRTGQEYNQRKKRKGAFWEDRYHATAVEGNEHLIHCMIYIDMNMVRAGVVSHPKEWPFCGYHEIQNPRQRYGIIDYQRLVTLLQVRDLQGVQETCGHAIEEALGSKNQVRESKWSEAIAVGSKRFVEATKDLLGIKAKGRRILAEDGADVVREPAAPYGRDFAPTNSSLRLNNTYFWNDYPDILIR